MSLGLHAIRSKRACSACSRFIVPSMAAEVTLATASPTPMNSASRSRPSLRVKVQSTSKHTACALDQSCVFLFFVCCCVVVMGVTPPRRRRRAPRAISRYYQTKPTCSARGLGLVGSVLTVRCAAPSRAARSSGDEVFLLLRGEGRCGAAVLEGAAAAIEGAATIDRARRPPVSGTTRVHALPAPRTRVAAHEGGARCSMAAAVRGKELVCRQQEQGV